MSAQVLRRSPLVLLVVLVVVLYTPIFNYWRFAGDFVAHTVYIERIRDNDPQVFIELPNLLYHVSVLLPATLFPQTALTDWITPICVLWFLMLALFIWGQMRAALT